MVGNDRDVMEPAPPRSGGAGFTVVEVLVAIGIIGAAMLTVLMAASSGVIFQGMARQRQTAVGVANQVMEQLRALPLTDLKNGIDDTNGALKNDPNVKACKGKGGGKNGATTAYRLFSCTGTADLGSAEAIVYYDCSKLKTGETCPSANAPLGSGNTGTITADGVPYTWHAYLTSRSTTLPLRFVAVVNWTWRGRPYSSRVQSLAWSPTGCVSNLTHFVSAPCGKGSGGQGDSGLLTVNVSWTNAGQNYSFSWSPGSLTGTYREEGSQGKYVSGTALLPNGAKASTTTDNDVSTTDAETATAVTVSTTGTAASYPSYPYLTTPGTVPYVEARFDVTSSTYWPSAQTVSGVSGTPCNVTPYFFTASPCLGMRATGGANSIVIGYRKSTSVSVPLVRIANVYDSAGPNMGTYCGATTTPCLWLVKYDFKPVTTGGTTTNTFYLWRNFPKIYLGAYSASTTEGAGCESNNASACATFVGSLTTVCDSVSLALGGSLQDAGLCTGSAAHSGTFSKTLMTTASCATAAPISVGTAGTNPPCIGGISSGRMWNASNFTAWPTPPATKTTSASISFDYQVLSCTYSDSGGGSPTLTYGNCTNPAGYTNGSESKTNAQGTKTSTRTITAATPLFRVTLIFPLLQASAVSYEDW